jgi:N6-L-threonylcarbamoyladenine synthase
MKILAIETSCDETAAAVVERQVDDDLVVVHSSVVATSLPLHEATGGIVPEVAAREQVKSIIPVIQKAFSDANTTGAELDAIAVTVGPGLIGSLLVGVETAKGMALAFNKPLIPINHVLAHVYANWVRGDVTQAPQFPALALIVSGGHTELVLLTSPGELTWLGGTRDDAAGECFDKCARLLGFPYPGGPSIARLAAERVANMVNPIQLPKPAIDTATVDMSFSGLKTAFLNQVRSLGTPKSDGYGYDLPESVQLELAYQLENQITDVLVQKVALAMEMHAPKSVLLAGGVAANTTLREKLRAGLQHSDAALFIPPLFLCTDNAIVIGACALFNPTSMPIPEIKTDPSLALL